MSLKSFPPPSIRIPKGNFVLTTIVIELSIFAFLIFIFTSLQNIVQVYASERVARDIRNEIAAKISVQPYAYYRKCYAPRDF